MVSELGSRKEVSAGPDIQSHRAPTRTADETRLGPRRRTHRVPRCARTSPDAQADRQPLTRIYHSNPAPAVPPIYTVPSLDLAIYKMSSSDAQLDSALTGLPVTYRGDHSRDNWKPGPHDQFLDGPVGGDDGVRRLPEMCSRWSCNRDLRGEAEEGGRGVARHARLWSSDLFVDRFGGGLFPVRWHIPRRWWTSGCAACSRPGTRPRLLRSSGYAPGAGRRRH
jgi:hypothetical protein